MTPSFPVVFQAAASDHVGSIKALIKGLQTRKYRTGKSGVYIHVRGLSLSLHLDSNSLLLDFWYGFSPR
jgi:hypothetical protein